MKKRIENIIITIVIILIILLLLGYFVFKFFSNDNSVEEFKTNFNTTPTSSQETTDPMYVHNPINFKALHKKNSEIFAWIKIPGTKVDYPVLQSEVSDNYYLHRGIDGKYKYAGSIYAQYCNSSELTDRVTVLYGHNMRDGSMFAGLHKFKDKSFFDSHDKFYVYTEDRKLTYQIVSTYVYDDRHIMNSFNFFEDDVFKEYLDFIQNPRSAIKNVRKKLDHELTTNDRIMTLSTCLDSGSGRYLLQGVLISDEFTGEWS